ncbi:MAG: hypothetical protein NVS1B11_36980 [Terriglobales bacterium]
MGVDCEEAFAAVPVSSVFAVGGVGEFAEGKTSGGRVSLRALPESQEAGVPSLDV